MSVQAMYRDSDLALKDKTRDFVASIPRQLLLDMDADKVHYPKEYLEEAGQRHLLGLRFPPKYGGAGLPWTLLIQANKGTVSLDNFREITFSVKK